MKKIYGLFAIAVLSSIMACGNKQKAASGDGGEATADSTLTAESAQEQPDTVPLPMFLNRDKDKAFLEMLYWTAEKEPLQDQFRRNAAQYKTLFDGDDTYQLKYLGEQLTNPDGEPASLGTIHEHAGLYSQSARYEVTEGKGKNVWGGIAVTDEYLATRKRLPIKYEASEHGQPKLPAEVVARLEKRYGMKAERSRKVTTIDGRYTLGCLQFKGEWKETPKSEYNNGPNALALEVVILGDSVWVCEMMGYIYDGRPGWDSDDDGEYQPCIAVEAFEGPQGLELCYMKNAPESHEEGMFFLRGGKLVQRLYCQYHVPYEERVPIWKKDIAEMQRLYKENALEDGTGELTRYALVNVDMDDEMEVLAREANDNGGGALFTRHGGKVQLICVESPRMRLHFRYKNQKGWVSIGGSMGGPTYYTKVVAVKGSQIVETFEMNEVYDDKEATLNGKKLSGEQAQAWLDALPKDERQPSTYWSNFKTE